MADNNEFFVCINCYRYDPDTNSYDLIDKDYISADTEEELDELLQEYNDSLDDCFLEWEYAE